MYADTKIRYSAAQPRPASAPRRLADESCLRRTSQSPFKLPGFSRHVAPRKITRNLLQTNRTVASFSTHAAPLFEAPRTRHSSQRVKRNHMQLTENKEKWSRALVTLRRGYAPSPALRLHESQFALSLREALFALGLPFPRAFSLALLAHSERGRGPAQAEFREAQPGDNLDQSEGPVMEHPCKQNRA